MRTEKQKSEDLEKFRHWFLSEATDEEVTVVTRGIMRLLEKFVENYVRRVDAQV